MRLSYSAINTYQSCPLMYKFSYIDNLPTKPKPKMEFGNFLHKTLQFILDDRYHLPTLAETVRFYAENFDKSVFSTEREAQNYFENGLKIVETFYKEIQEKTPPVMTTEEKFVLPIGKHQLAGIFDRIDKHSEDTFEIVDYKTGKVPDQQKIDKDLQLTTYDWAAKTKWPQIKDLKLTLHFLGPNIKLSTSRDKSHHQQLEEVVSKTAEKIEKGEFEPRPNSLCNYCDYQEFCPLMKDKFRKEKKEIDEIIKKYLKLKKEEQSLKEELKVLEPYIHNYLDQSGVEKLFSKLGTISRSKRKKINAKLEKKR